MDVKPIELPDITIDYDDFIQYCINNKNCEYCIFKELCNLNDCLHNEYDFEFSVKIFNKIECAGCKWVYNNECEHPGGNYIPEEIFENQTSPNWCPLKKKLKELRNDRTTNNQNPN
jgi:hypothetical protein